MNNAGGVAMRASLLFIDGMQEEILGASAQKIDWNKDGGDAIAAWLSTMASPVASEGHSEQAEALWRDKEQSVLGFVCPMLVAIRDAGYAKLDVATVFKALELESIQKLISIEWIDELHKAQARRHLGSLPGYADGVGHEDQPGSSLEAHDYLRFEIELPIRRALGMGFGDHPPIAWEKIPKSTAEKVAIEERAELQAWLERKPKKGRRRL